MKRFLIPLLSAVVLPTSVSANPAIYGPQMCTMLRSNIPIDKAWKYVTDAHVQRIIDREKAYGGFETEFGVAISAGIEANRVLGGMREDVFALALSQCPYSFWKGYANVAPKKIKSPGSLGFTSISINGTRYISSVFEGGEAFLKGIKPGSIIHEVNNENIMDKSTKEYVKIMPKNVDEKVTLLIEYDGNKEIYELVSVPSENINWPKGTKLKIKKIKPKNNSSSNSMNINCNSTVWEKKPVCN